MKMIERFWGGLEQQRSDYKEKEMEKIKKRLKNSWSENDASNNMIDEINQSDDPLDSTLKKIDEGKDISYIMKTLKRISFVDKNDPSYSDPEYRRIKNSEAKKQITEKVLNKEWWWKIVLDNWESVNDLTSQDKNSLVQTFKLMIKNSEWVQKEQYYYYLDKKIVEIWTKDPEASILFNEVLRQKEVELDDQLARDLNTNPDKTARDYLSWWYSSGWNGFEGGAPDGWKWNNWWQSGWREDFSGGDFGEWDYWNDYWDESWKHFLGGDFGDWEQWNNSLDGSWESEDDGSSGSSDGLWEWWNELDGPDEDMFTDPNNLFWDPYGLWGDEWKWNNWW